MRFIYFSTTNYLFWAISAACLQITVGGLFHSVCLENIAGIETCSYWVPDEHIALSNTSVYITQKKIKSLISDFQAPPNAHDGLAMWVKTAQVFQGETFYLYFKPPNQPFLGVLDPKGRFFYLVYPGSSSFGNLRPLIESNLFIRLDSLEIPTGIMKADPYAYGVFDNQPVFTHSGHYTFILGDNLHVDDPTDLHKVSINYQHHSRTTSGSNLRN
jgi:hypothetical protein